MEFRLLRYFVVVAEELHLARAAARLGIEQSPVSRAMRELERRLEVALFDRSTRLTRLTPAGQALLGEGRRVLAVVDQAIQVTKGVAQGYQSYLRIAICDSLTQPLIATLLARSREEEPELEIRLFDLPFSQQLKGLHTDLLDVGFAQSGAINDGLVAEPVWNDPMSVIMPARHPLLARARVKLADALKFPLVLCHPDTASGSHDQILAVLDGAKLPLKVVAQATNLGVMLTLVGAGYGIGFAIASQVQALNRPDIATRPLEGTQPILSTYLVRRGGEPSDSLKRFISRVKRLSAKPDGEPGT